MNDVLHIPNEETETSLEPIKVTNVLMAIKKVTTNNSGILQITLEGAATPVNIPDTAAILALQHLELVKVTLESCDE